MLTIAIINARGYGKYRRLLKVLAQIIWWL